MYISMPKALITDVIAYSFWVTHTPSATQLPSFCFSSRQVRVKRYNQKKSNFLPHFLRLSHPENQFRNSCKLFIFSLFCRCGCNLGSGYAARFSLTAFLLIPVLHRIDNWEGSTHRQNVFQIYIRAASDNKKCLYLFSL